MFRDEWLQVDEEPHQEDVLLVRARGELEVYTVMKLKDTLKDRFRERGARHLFFECSDVEACDSTGVGMFVAASKWAREAGGRLVLVAPSRNTRLWLTATGLDGVFLTAESVAEAREKAEAQVASEWAAANKLSAT